ncbi:LOW QUALITY PROTEIN: isoamyl acetate-hydrolyzing esterase 1 homolog [Asterias amurensis]|uniref:LOW QUALITY PROTEIN: isoamyl acetate-hydrolyzing esterase 1 homolog n=1 Tax=Asterias amurensis TaxID=7602 RepID=UPI003AB4AA70
MLCVAPSSCSSRDGCILYCTTRAQWSAAAAAASVPTHTGKHIIAFCVFLGSTMKMSWHKVILFGDSLSQFAFSEGGWGSSLANLLQRKCDVLNRGFSGYNSTWGRIALPRCIPKEDIPHIAMVTIFFGANDSVLEETRGAKFVSLDDFSANLQDMVQYLVDGGMQSDNIIIISPPPLDDKVWSKGCLKNESPVNRKNSNTGLYAKACCRVSKECSVECLDVWTLMQEEQNWQRFLVDGLHLSEEGSRFLGQHLLRMAEVKTSKLSTQLPDWKDIDVANPEKSFPS